MFKNTRQMAATAALSVLVLVAACSTTAPPPPPPANQPIQNPGKAVVAVSDADADSKIVLDRAQALVVRLATIPTEGYEWSLVNMKPGVLKLVNSEFERTRRDLDVFENPGETVFRFTASGGGEVTLTFWLRKPRSLEPAVRVLSMTATVR